MPIATVSTEDMITSEIREHLGAYFWNRCIITGAGSTGKTTYIQRLGRELGFEGFHAPNFEMTEEDTYMYLKYEYLICRWYPWDRFVYGKAEPILDTYTHDILPVIFINEPFCEDKHLAQRGDFQRQKDRYLELADMMEASGNFNRIILYTGGSNAYNHKRTP